MSERRPRSKHRGRRGFLRRFKLVRVLRKDRLFAFAFVALGSIALVTTAAIPRVWKVTPDSYPYSPIRISAIDAVQSWSLARGARKARALGRFNDAVFSWQGAIANNPGNPELHRELLRTLAAQPGIVPEDEPLAASTARWLFSLTGTNVPDLLLAADILDLHGGSDLALRHIEPIPMGTHDAVDRARARYSVQAGRFEDFAQLWQAQAGTWETDTNLALHADGWRYATDDRSVGLAAGTRLKEALSAPAPRGIHAARLLQLGAARRGQTDDLALAIRHLESANAASLGEYGQLWRLLAASGRTEEAKAQAIAYRGSLHSTRASLLYLEALRDLGLRTEALRFLDQNIERFGAAVELWRLYYDLLAEKSSWDDLRRLAGAARVLSTRKEALFAEALFADYRGAMGQERRREADQLRLELADLEISDLPAALRIAARLRIDDHPDSALALLRGNEKALADHAAYWNEVFAVGYSLRDMTLLRRAVAELLRRHPHHAAWKNNRAALLLLTGEAPAEALQLTLEGVSRQPRSVAFRVNHAIALLQNGRPRESLEILDTIDAQQLPSDVGAAFHLARAEALGAVGQTAAALDTARLVDRARLLPQQAERLERILSNGR